MNRIWLIAFIVGLLAVTSVTGQCISESGRSKLIPFGSYLLGIQKQQDSLQLAILSTKYICLTKGDKSNIEFEDGTFIYISNLLDLNCDGKAYFNLTEEDKEALRSKSVSKIVLGSKFEGYTTSAYPEAWQSMALLKLLNCIRNEENSVTSPKIDPTTATMLDTIDKTTLEDPTIPSIKDSIVKNASPSSFETQSNTIIPQAEVATLPLRTVQFIATSGGKPFRELAYLGTIISEKVANKNIYRYKIQGHFSNTEIQHVISALAKHGYKGAFEN